jgi:hypothetical protein
MKDARRGADQLSPVLVGTVVATGLLMIPMAGVAPLLGLLAAIATSAVFVGKITR